ncbi:TetR/AcrR family transcriptional regulator [Macrococcus animalis]|uniref:TetR/AcrR family transcriptional regulator n=1 Tax=Macrococcus animalis TaxID=3395467 RepID=UPI0039BE3DE4
MRGKITNDLIIETTLKILNEKTPGQVELKELAELLNIKSPSLYKHISNLAHLHDLMAQYSLKTLFNILKNADQFESLDENLKSVLIAYRNFALEFPSLYEYTQNTNYWQSDETRKLSDKIVNQFNLLMGGSDNEVEVHKIRMIRSFLTGFIHLELNNGFSMDESVEASFLYGINNIMKTEEKN